MTFQECVLETAKNKELVKEFDRLTDSNLSLDGSNIVLLIDKASGKLEDDMRKFVEFVYEVVWCRLL